MSKSELSADAIERIKNEVIPWVGYGAPPREHQFKKGQSGNPKGRPRKASTSNKLTTHADNYSAIINEVLAETVMLNLGGKRKAVSKAEALQRNLEKLAFGGSVNATRDLRQQLKQLDGQKRLALEKDHAFWRDYQYRSKLTLKLPNENKDESGRFWIAPEDIVIRPGALTMIKGPVAPEEQAYYTLLENLLRLLMFEVSYDAYCYAREGDPPRTQLKTIAVLQNVVSSNAARACDAYWDNLQNKHTLIIKSWREAERQRIWAAAELPMPRKRWLTPMSAKDIKYVESQRDPLLLLLDQMMQAKRRRKNRAISRSAVAHGLNKCY